MADYEDEPEHQGKLSKYNSGVAQIYRLDELWRNCHLAKKNGNYLNWKITMDSIWSELIRDLDPEGKEFKKYDLEYKRFLIECYRKQNNKNELYNVMLKEESWLGHMQNSLGKGTAYEEDADSYMDN